MIPAHLHKTPRLGKAAQFLSGKLDIAFLIRNNYTPYTHSGIRGGGTGQTLPFAAQGALRALTMQQFLHLIKFATTDEWQGNGIQEKIDMCPKISFVTCNIN